MDGDGRPDFLYGAGTGLLVLNTPKGFVEAKDSGISYKPGKVGPVFGDFDGDGQPDLFVPQAGGCKLFQQRRQGPLHRRDRQGRRPGRSSPGTPPAPPGATSTTTATSTWSSAA